MQVDQHYHQAAVRDIAHRTLEQRLANMLANYRNPAIPPFDASRLVAAYNACVPAGGLRFVHGRAECALELLSNGRDGILGHLQLAAGFLVTYLQEGDCPTCNTRFQLVSVHEKKVIPAKRVGVVESEFVGVGAKIWYQEQHNIGCYAILLVQSGTLVPSPTPSPSCTWTCSRATFLWTCAPF